jgi:hypothetical protein
MLNARRHGVKPCSTRVRTDMYRCCQQRGTARNPGRQRLPGSFYKGWQKMPGRSAAGMQGYPPNPRRCRLSAACVRLARISHCLLRNAVQTLQENPAGELADRSPLT